MGFDKGCDYIYNRYRECPIRGTQCRIRDIGVPIL